MKKSLKLIILILVVLLLGSIIYFVFISHNSKLSIEDIQVTGESDMLDYSSGIPNVGANEGSGATFNFQGQDYHFLYPIGYTVGICDEVWFWKCYGHTGTLKKYGLVSSNFGYLVKTVYFSGDPDIEGWYYEGIVPELYNNIYGRYSEMYVIELK